MLWNLYWPNCKQFLKKAETFGKNNISKINCKLKNQYEQIIHYKQMHKEEIPDNLSNVYKVQLLKKQVWIIQNNGGLKN